MTIVWLGLIIPLIATIVLIVFFKKQTAVLEIIGLWVASLFIIFLAKFFVDTFDANETEYWGEYAIRVEYYEEWDEWIIQTCTREVPCGTDSKGNTRYCTETYDCSHRDYHSPYWQAITNLGNSYSITQKKYNEFMGLWNNRKFIDMDRHYYTIDGNKYESYWDNKDYNILPIITTHSYKNKVVHSSSIYEFPEVDTSAYHLFEYPEVEDYNCNSILSEVKNKDIKWADKLLTYYNAKYGSSKQVRMWLLIYKNKPFQYGTYQENYWKGGNKNEVVLCMGIDKDLSVQWAKVFSWTERENLKTDLRDSVLFQKKLDIYKTVNVFKDQVVEKFQRRDFSEFDYLETEPSPLACIISFLIIGLCVTGMSVYIVKNQFTNRMEEHG